LIASTEIAKYIGKNPVVITLCLNEKNNFRVEVEKICSSLSKKLL